MISSGAKKDLLIINFARSMIEVSKQDSSIKDESLDSRVSNKNYKENKRIDRHLAVINEKLFNTIDSVYKEGGRETVEWVQKNLQKRIGNTLTRIQESKINLEMLALWVLYVNFSEIDRPLHNEYLWLRDGKQFLDVVDLMEKTEIGHINGNMFQEAYEVIERIKR